MEKTLKELLLRIHCIKDMQLLHYESPKQESPNFSQGMEKCHG